MTTGIPLSPTGGTSYIRTSAAVREARQFIKEAFAGQDLGGVHFPDGEVSFSALSEIWTGKGGHPAVLAAAASRMKHMAWTDAPEDNIFGHSWEDIQGAQQGGQLSRQKIDLSKPGGPSPATPEDIAMLEQHGADYLKENWYGRYDRLVGSGYIQASRRTALTGDKDFNNWMADVDQACERKINESIYDMKVNFSTLQAWYGDGMEANAAAAKACRVHMKDGDGFDVGASRRVAWEGPEDSIEPIHNPGWPNNPGPNVKTYDGQYLPESLWSEKNDHDGWLPAAGGAETPIDFQGQRYLYVYNPATGKHGWLNLNTDIIEDEDWTPMTASRREAAGARWLVNVDWTNQYQGETFTANVKMSVWPNGDMRTSSNAYTPGLANVAKEVAGGSMAGTVTEVDEGQTDTYVYSVTETLTAGREVTGREAGAFRVAEYSGPGWYKIAALDASGQVQDTTYKWCPSANTLDSVTASWLEWRFRDSAGQMRADSEFIGSRPDSVRESSAAVDTDWAYKAGYQGAQNGIPTIMLDRQFLGQLGEAPHGETSGWVIPYLDAWVKGHAKAMQDDGAQAVAAGRRVATMDDFTQQHLEKWLSGYPEDVADEYRAKILSMVESDPDLLNDHGWREILDMAETTLGARRTASYKIGDQVQWSDAFASRPGLDSALDDIGNDPLIVQEVKNYTTGDALYGVGTIGGDLFWVEPSDLKPAGQVTGARPDDPDMHGGGYFEEVSPMTAARRLAWLAQQQYDAFESNVKGFINSFPSGSVVKRYASDCFARLVADLHSQWPWINDIQMGSYDWPDESAFGVDPMDAAAIRDAISSYYSRDIDSMMAAASRRTAEPNYEESKHPRANDGKFTSGPGGGGASDKPDKDKAATPTDKDYTPDDEEEAGDFEPADTDAEPEFDASESDDDWVREEDDDEGTTDDFKPEFEGAETGILSNPSKAADSGLESYEAFKNSDGTWKPERKKLHAQAESDILEGVTPVDSPVFILMGGGPAAGKSTMVNTGALTLPDNMASVNSDEIKTGDKRFKNFKGLPEYKTMADAGDERAAAFCHEESSEVCKGVMAKALGQSMNTLLDGTGDGGLEGIKKKCNAARKAGHKVTGHYAIIDADEGVRRANERAKKTGRKVPEDYIRETYANIYRDLPQAVAAGCFDELTLWDTGEKGKATPMMEVRDGKVTIHDKEAVAKHFGDVEWQTQSKQSQAKTWRKSLLTHPLAARAASRGPGPKTSTTAWSNSAKRSRMRDMSWTSPQTTETMTPLAGMMTRRAGSQKIQTAGSTLATGIPLAPMKRVAATPQKIEAADPPEWAFNWGDRDYDQATAEDAPEKREAGLPVGLGKTSGYDFDVFDGWDLNGQELRPKRG